MRYSAIVTALLMVVAPAQAGGRYAQVKDGVVQRVVRAPSREWCETRLGGVWVETTKGSGGKNFAGIGYSYIAEKENFATKCPHVSWVMTADCKWQAPAAIPTATNGKKYTWDDKTGSWTVFKGLAVR